MNNPVAWCLAYFANKYCSGLIKELTTEQVLVSFLKGDIKLGDMELSPKRFPELQLEMTRGQIKSFYLSIPWHKVLLSESCIVVLEISNIQLDFKRLKVSPEPAEDPDELKEKLLRAFEEKIQSRRSSFNKLLEVLSSKFINIEVVEFILSRLEIRINGVQVTIRSANDKNGSLELSLESFKITPTDSEFQEFAQKTSNIWEKIQGLGSVAIQRSSVALSDSLLQFKVISLKSLNVSLTKPQDINLNLTNQVKVSLVEVKSIEAFYSSKNYLWLGQSDRDTDVHIKALVSEVKCEINNKNLTEINLILEPKFKRLARSRKENWAKARELVLNKVRMKSWLFITKKILWKSIYKKLYSKYVLKIIPESSAKAEVKSSSDGGVRNFFWFLVPQIEYVAEAKAKPKSDIIPAFHFNASCPVEELEQALMADLEKNLDISEIIKYRQEEQDRFDYEQFEKAKKKNHMIKSNFRKIDNYFKSKGKVTISKSDDSKVVNLTVQGVISKVDIRLKVQKMFFLDILLFNIVVEEECQFTEPIFRYKQTNYDRKSLTTISIDKFEVFDLLANDSKIIKKVFEVQSRASFEVVYNLKYIYDSGFSKSVTQKIGINIPEIFAYVVPNFYNGMTIFFSEISKQNYSEYMREDHLMELLEPIQDFKINYKSENPLVLNLNILKCEVFIACSYSSGDPVLNFKVGGLSLKNSSNKLQVDIKYIEGTSATLQKYSEASSLFLPCIFRTQQSKITNAENKTEIIIKTIQNNLSNEELSNIFKIVNAWTGSIKPSDCPDQVIRVSLKTKWIEHTLQRILSSFMISINLVFANINTGDSSLQVIIKTFVYSSAVFFLETDSCISAREITVTNTLNNQMLFHMFSSEEPETILALPGRIFLYRDTQAAFYLITQKIDKINAKYKNISSATEFTFSNFHIGVDLNLIEWLLDLLKQLSDDTSEASFEFNAIVISKVIFHGVNLSVDFLNSGKSNYFFISEKALVIIDQYYKKSEYRVKLINPSLIDVLFESSYHSSILSGLEEESCLDIYYMTRENLSGKFVESTNEIRLTNTKMTFLNRVVMEAYEYFYSKLMNVFSSPQASEKKNLSTLTFIIKNSEIWVPRNSVTYDGFTIKFDYIEITNRISSHFQDTHFFEHEAEQKDTENNEKRIINLSMIQEEFRKKSNFFEYKASKNKGLQTSEVSYVNPAKIKRYEGKYFCGVDIYYYNPDKEIHFKSPTPKSKIITKEDDPVKIHENYSIPYFLKNKSSDSSPSSSILAASPDPDQIQGSYGVSQNSLYEDSSGVVEEVLLEGIDYKIKMHKCSLLDVYRNLITEEDFTLSFEINSSSSPMNIFIKSERKSFNLNLYENYFNILIKTFQENFCELTNCEPSKDLGTGEEYLILKILLDDFRISVFNECLDKGLEELPRTSQLCDITFTNFSVDLNMLDTGRKNVNIEASHFRIEDKRSQSLFTFPGDCPLVYMHTANPDFGDFYICEKSVADTSGKIQLKKQNMSKTVNLLEVDNKFSVNLCIDKGKITQISFNYAIFIVLPDFFYDLLGFFQSPYNTEKFPVPDNIKFLHDEHPEDMSVVLNTSNLHILLLSSLDKTDSTCFLIRLKKFSLEILMKGDSNTGPGTMVVNSAIKLEGGHLVPSKHGLFFTDLKFFDSLIEPYKLNINYLYHKPIKNASSATIQVNIRSSKKHDLKINLDFSSIPILREILNRLKQPSSQNEPTLKTEQPKSDVKIEDTKNQISVNLAVYGFYCKLLNDQMQPIFQANIKEILSAYQQEQTVKNCEANFIMVLQVDYFNQKLMAWEPAIEEWGLEIQYSCAEGFSLIQISEYNKVLQVNISASLISTLSTIMPILSNLSKSSQNADPSNEPYFFENLTGVPLRLQIIQKGWLRCIEKELDPEGKVPITLDELNQMNSANNPQSLTYEKKTLNIDINPQDSIYSRPYTQLKFRKVTHIGIDTPDTYFIYLENYGDKHQDDDSKPKQVKKRKKIENKYTIMNNREFLPADDFPEQAEVHQAEEDVCLSILKRKLKYRKRLAKGKAIPTSEKEDNSKISFIVDVQWNQESSQRVITIRSSMSVVNTLPCGMKISFSVNEDDEDLQLDLDSNQKVPVPLLVCNKGTLKIYPSFDYESCKIIEKVEHSIVCGRNLSFSCIDGIIDKDILTRVHYQNKGEIELGFIPLCCTNVIKELPNFYFAVTVKKIPNSNPVRRVEQAKNSQEVHEKGMIGFKKKTVQKNIREFESEENEEKFDEEFQLDSTSDETEIIITSIVSFTNALSQYCKVSVWTGGVLNKPLEYIELKQGQTAHLYHLNFYEESFNMTLSIKGYEECQALQMHPLNIDKERKTCIELQKIKKNQSSDAKQSSLYLWVRMIEDENRCWRLSVYSPYWIINKTSLKLKYGEPRLFRKKKLSNEDDSDESFSEINSNEEGQVIEGDKISKIKTFKRGRRFRKSVDIKRFHAKESNLESDTKEYDEKDWKLISLFSTSKIISKVNVAVNIDGKESKWSQNFSLTNSGTSGELGIEGHDGVQYDLGVKIEKGQGVFQQTNVITFRPLYLLKNNYKRELSIRQLDIDKRKALWNLIPNSEVPVYFYNCKGEKSLSVAVNLGEGREITKRWSGAFNISELGEFIIRLPMDHIDERVEDDLFMQVSIISNDPMIVIQFTENSSRIPYELQNFTSHEIRFHQLLSSKSSIQVKQRELRPALDAPTKLKYAWDEENSPHSLVISIGKITKTIDFDRFQKFAPVKIDEGIWAEAVMKKKKKEGKIWIKMNKWLKEKKTLVILTEKWVIIQDDKKKTINLDTYCTKVVYIDNNSFVLQTCTKTIHFRSDNNEELMEWYELIGLTIRNKVSNTQLFVNISVELKGVTHVMKFENEDSTKSQKHNKKCKKGFKEGEALEDTESIQELFTFKIDINDIIFSLIDNSPQERICLYLNQFDLMYTKYENNTFGVHFSVDELKIDNQQANSHIPVILNPYSNSKAAHQKTIIFHIIAERLEELDNINFLKFMIAPLEIKLDESIISNMIEYYNFIQKTFQLSSESHDLHMIETKEFDQPGSRIKSVSRDPSTALMLELVCAQLISNQGKDLTIEKRIYIHTLVLGPLEFCVTLDKDNISTRNKKSNLIQTLADLGLALTSIDSTELRLAGFKIGNLLQPRSQFIMSMINHYKTQGIRELYKIVGSVELLGNPFALINSLKSGVKEMFFDPAVALIESPDKFGESLLKGSVGLVRHTVHGLLKSVGNLTGGIGRLLTAMTLDKRFQNKMRHFKSRRAENIGDRFKIGLKTVAYGFVEGITGLVTAPIQGIKQGGFGGLIKGIGKGIIGTVAKPTAGIVGTVSDAFSGIGNFAKKKHNVKNTERTRPPRSFDSDRILKPYDEMSSQGQYYLSKAFRCVTYQKIYLLLEIMYKKKHRALIVTNKSIYVIRTSNFNGFEIPKKAIVTAVLENHIIAVTVFMDSTELDENLIEVKNGYKKKLLRDICMSYEDDPKTPNHGIFNISLKGMKEHDREGDLSVMLEAYVKYSQRKSMMSLF